MWADGETKYACQREIQQGGLTSGILKGLGGGRVGRGLSRTWASLQRGLVEKYIWRQLLHVNLGRRRQSIQGERQPLEPVAAELCGASIVTSNRRRRTESSLSDESCPSSAGTDVSALLLNCGER